MILPTKHLKIERSLIHVGASVLSLLDEPKTVSRLWEEVKSVAHKPTSIPYDWFVLCLDLLYALGAVELTGGRIRRAVS